MARKVSVNIVSDISGDILSEEQAETITYALDGVEYEIDLSHEEASSFRSKFEDFTSVSRKIGRASSANSGRKSASAEETKKIRAWAAENGVDVPARGRISGEIREKYHASLRG